MVPSETAAILGTACLLETIAVRIRLPGSQGEESGLCMWVVKAEYASPPLIASLDQAKRVSITAHAFPGKC